MPRGKQKKNTEQESHNPQELHPAVAPTQETENMVQTGGLEEHTPDEQNLESSTADSHGQEFAPMTVAQYMEYFQLDVHPPEIVNDFVGKLRQELALEMGAAAIPQQDRAPVNQIPQPIPLNVKITSLEMDGDTRAFARAKYGDLTINRIRVKQDRYGALSVTMPKFRQPDGWKETCCFDTIEPWHRLTEATLGAYEQQLILMQGQAQTETGTPEQEQVQGDGMEENQDVDSQEQEGQEREGPSMGMNMSQ